MEKEAKEREKMVQTQSYKTKKNVKSKENCKLDCFVRRKLITCVTNALD